MLNMFRIQSVFRFLFFLFSHSVAFSSDDFPSFHLLMAKFARVYINPDVEYYQRSTNVTHVLSVFGLAATNKSDFVFFFCWHAFNSRLRFICKRSNNIVRKAAHTQAIGHVAKENASSVSGFILFMQNEILRELALCLCCDSEWTRRFSLDPTLHVHLTAAHTIYGKWCMFFL